MRLIGILCICVVLSSCSKERRPTSNSTTVALDTSAAAISPDTLVLEHNGKLFLIFPGQPQVPQLTSGYDPSPVHDGYFSFTSYDSSGNRYIAVYNLNDHSQHVIRSGIGDNNFGPSLSPDNKTLIFHHFDNGQWSVGSCDLSGNNFKTLTPAPAVQFGGFFQPKWFSDGSGFLCQNLDTLFEFSKSGQLLASVPTRSLVNTDTFGISSSSLFYLDSKRGRYYFEGGSDIDEPPYFAPYAIFSYDKATHKTIRLSPDSIHAVSPYWSERSKLFYFRGYTKREAEAIDPRDSLAIVTYSLYCVHEDGSGLKKVFSDSSFHRIK